MSLLIYNYLAYWYRSMFESVQNFFGNVKSFFQQSYDWVSNEVHAGYEYVKSGVKSIAEAPKKIIQTVYGDGKKLVVGVDHDVNKVLNRGSHTIDNLVNKRGEVIQSGQQVIGKTVGGLGESLSMPLVAGGVVLAFLLFKK